MRVRRTGQRSRGGPRRRRASPLQARIDAAAPGDAVDGERRARTTGDLVIDGRSAGRDAAGPGSSAPATAASCASAPPAFIIDGFDIDGRGGGDLGRDTSGIHVAAPRAAIRDCRIANTLFGIYLREADDAVVEQQRHPRHPRPGAGREGHRHPRLEHRAASG